VTEAPLRNQIKEPQDKKRIFISNYTRTWQFQIGK
jgi:hypothetical protein